MVRRTKRAADNARLGPAIRQRCCDSNCWKYNLHEVAGGANYMRRIPQMGYRSFTNATTTVAVSKEGWLRERKTDAGRMLTIVRRRAGKECGRGQGRQHGRTQGRGQQHKCGEHSALIHSQGRINQKAARYTYRARFGSISSLLTMGLAHGRGGQGCPQPVCRLCVEEAK